jgi:hypothetical protein
MTFKNGRKGEGNKEKRERIVEEITENEKETQKER